MPKFKENPAPFKMKYQDKRSAFPFKSSPVKQEYRPFEKGPFHPGHSTELPRRVPTYNPTEAPGPRQVEEVKPTPEEYLAQGLNRWGGTDLSI